MNFGETRTVSPNSPSNLFAFTTLTDTLIKNGRAYTSAYNAATRTFTNTTPAGRQSTSAIDELGRVIQRQKSGLNAVQYAYDSKGRLSGVTQGSGPDARSYVFQYNPQGYLSSVIDPMSNSTGFEYDLAGRITKQVLQDDSQVLYAFDSNGSVTLITPPGKPSHTFAYNSVGLMLEYDPPDAFAGTDKTRYGYNLDRQLTEILRPDGQVISYGYDTAGRLNTLSTSDGSVIYTHDPTRGYLTVINWPDGNSISLTHDGIHTTGETWGGEVSGSVSWTYDDSFRPNGISVNNGNTISYQYDNDGLITMAGDLGIVRNAQNGLVTGTTLGSVSDELTYNTFGETTVYVARYGSTEIFRQQFTRDLLGRVNQKVETVEGTTNTYDYYYDASGRLTTVKRNGVTSSTYAYDSNDNRLSKVSSNDTISGTYDNQDRLTQYGDAVYSYTSNGELMSKTRGVQTTQYGYDAFGDLKAVTLPDGIVVEYSVDGVGRRTGRKIDGTWDRKFLYYNDVKPVAELDGNNNIKSLFVYGGQSSAPNYLIKGAITYRIISDHVGSPRLVVDITSGIVVQRMDYDEFGNVVNDTYPGFQPFGFAGGIYDPQTQLIRFGARDYDAEVGRWTTKDPLLFNGMQQNLYAYVSNDPVNNIDPGGTQGRGQGRGGGLGQDFEGIKADAARSAAQATAAGARPRPETPSLGGGGSSSGGGDEGPVPSIDDLNKKYKVPMCKILAAIKQGGKQGKSLGDILRSLARAAGKLGGKVGSILPYLPLLEVLDVFLNPDRKVCCEDINPVFRIGCSYCQMY